MEFKGLTVAKNSKLAELLAENRIREAEQHVEALDARFRKEANLPLKGRLDFLRPIGAPSELDNPTIQPVSGVSVVSGTEQGRQLEPPEGTS